MTSTQRILRIGSIEAGLSAFLYLPGSSLLATCGSCTGLLASACFSGGVRLKSPQIPD